MAARTPAELESRWPDIRFIVSCDRQGFYVTAYNTRGLVEGTTGSLEAFACEAMDKRLLALGQVPASEGTP